MTPYLQRFAAGLILAGGFAVPATGISAAAANDDGRAPAAFDAPEADEALSGGQATSTRTPNRNAFSHSSANLPFAKELNFKVGNGFFRRLWVTAPASTQAADGLGPLYNARACQRCHLKDGRGHPPAGNHPEDDAVSMFLRLSIPPRTDGERALLASGRAAVIPEPTYGGQLQDFAIAGIRAEGRMEITYAEEPVALGDGTVVSLRRPTYRVVDPQYGPLHPDTLLSPRVAPPMIGLGLLELVPEAAIVADADPDDANGDGISGRAQRVWDVTADRLALGRFGWKAGNPTVDQQSQGAFAGDMGLSTPLFPDGAGECTDAQADCRAAPNGNSPQYEDLEVPTKVATMVLFYARNLAVPARRGVDDPRVLAGKELFHGAGCASCHRPRFVTGDDPAQPHLSNQTIRPFTDLLLHDMGPGLADGRPEGRADGREWRTAPLWGIGLTERVSGHTQFLHDGRARSLLEAILWHGGEAQAARDAVAALDADRRADLIRFLESL